MFRVRITVSRVKSLNGLMVLQPFCRSRITCNMQQDVQDKLKRQRLLELLTLAQNGDGELAQTAAAELKKLCLDEDKTLHAGGVELDLSSSNLDTSI